ncbi:signal peptidase I [Cellulomonas cellasea]|uniref:signal peptidase I n=1 Tax=Cellulomonas cellasea TaxID=43670 RepID=UPI0025A41561|nr:signal peptidase I [Cellulomonas cellasea]MDM8084856.1 signal peptidase I [Cellulomonas cellasea]
MIQIELARREARRRHVEPEPTDLPEYLALAARTGPPGGESTRWSGGAADARWSAARADAAARAAGATPTARWRRVVTGVLWGVVVLFSTAYATSLAVPLWFELHHQQVLVVTSGSMSGGQSGGFDAGDAVVMRRLTDPSQLKVGQVVSFWPQGSDHLVTHRIVSMHYLPVMRQDEATGQMVTTYDQATGEPVLRPYIMTKGDANAEPDPDATPFSRVRGVVLDVYPRWGWVLEWARSATGRLTMLTPPLLALATMELMSVLRERALTRGLADAGDARRGRPTEEDDRDLLLD